MEYFLFNQKTNQSEGPYSNSMLRELVKEGKLIPDSLLCPPGGNEWVKASTLIDLFTPAPIPTESTRSKDDFVHPFSKKGILTEQKKMLFYRGVYFISGGVVTLVMGAAFYFFFVNIFGGFMKFYMKALLVIPTIIGCLSFMLFGIYSIKKSKKIKVED